MPKHAYSSILEAVLERWAMSRKSRGFKVMVEEAYPVSLKIFRNSRGVYRWEIDVKASSIEEAENSAHKIDEWCRSVFTAPSAKAGDVATSRELTIANPLPEPVFPIKYRGRILGKIMLGHDKTVVKIDDSCRIKLEDPAISSFLIKRVIYPICDKLQAKWNPMEVDGYLREIVIDKPLYGEDAGEFIESARWAIKKAFSRLLKSRGKDGSESEASQESKKEES
jgi:hypothetical protein